MGRKATYGERMDWRGNAPLSAEIYEQLEVLAALDECDLGACVRKLVHRGLASGEPLAPEEVLPERDIAERVMVRLPPETVKKVVHLARKMRTDRGAILRAYVKRALAPPRKSTRRASAAA